MSNAIDEKVKGNFSFVFFCICQPLFFVLHGGELFWESLLILSLNLTCLSLFFVSNDLTNYKNIQPVLLGFLLYLMYLLIYITGFINQLNLLLLNITNPNIEHINLIVNFLKYNLNLPMSIIFMVNISISYTSFLLAYTLISNERRLHIFFDMLILIVLLICIYSLANYFFENKYIIFESLYPFENSWNSSFLGTFSYKNHFAILLIVISYINIFQLITKSNAKNTKISFKIFYILSYCIFVYTFFMSDSRGAFFSAIISTLFGLIVFLKKTHKTTHHYSKLLINSIISKKYVVSMAVILLISVFLNSNVYDRLTKTKLDSSGRLESYKVASEIFVEFPAFGLGPNSYKDLYHLYKNDMSVKSNKFIYVHNDYLEILATQGGIGLFFFMIPLFFIFRLILNRNFEIQKAILFISILCPLLHSLIDYTIGLSYIFSLVLIISAVCIRYSQLSVTNE